MQLQKSPDVYPELRMLVGGVWHKGAGSSSVKVVNPFDDAQLGEVPMIDRVGLANAVEAARNGFDVWSGMTPIERSSIMRRVASIVRERIY